MPAWLLAILQVFFGSLFDAIDKQLSKPKTSATAEKPPEQDAFMDEVRKAIAEGKAPPP